MTPPLGTLLGGKYQLTAVLGEGGMGKVYLAENVDIGRPVAIKVLRGTLAGRPELLERFRTEARAAAAVGHPGIVEIIDLGTSVEGVMFMVMERLEGESLGGRLRRTGPLSLAAAGSILDAALDALGAAHARGIVHRDLKPDNIFLAERPLPRVKLLDFGLSKFHRAEELALTQEGMAMGTAAYMAPEQARSARDAGTGADLYAMGAILFEMLAGRPPFLGESYGEVLAKVLTEPPPALEQLRAGVPPRLAALTGRLLEKSPGARLPDTSSVRAGLAEILGAICGPESWLPSAEEAEVRDSRATPTPLRPERVLISRTGPSDPRSGLEPTLSPAPGLRPRPEPATGARRWWLLVIGLLLAGGATLLSFRFHRPAPGPEAVPPSLPAPVAPAPMAPEPKPRLAGERTAAQAEGTAGPAAKAKAKTNRPPVRAAPSPPPAAEPPPAGLTLDKASPYTRPNQ